MPSKYVAKKKKKKTAQDAKIIITQNEKRKSVRRRYIRRTARRRGILGNVWAPVFRVGHAVLGLRYPGYPTWPVTQRSCTPTSTRDRIPHSAAVGSSRVDGRTERDAKKKTDIPIYNTNTQTVFFANIILGEYIYVYMYIYTVVLYLPEKITYLRLC